MIQIIKELNIEVSKPNVFQAVVAKQYDMNTRFIKATFVDYGEKITIPQSATLKVVINALRNDGLSKGFEGEINEDGTVTVPLHSWMLELVGTVVCDISVVDTAEDDEKKLTTTSFTLIVEKAAWGGDDIATDPQGDVLIELLNRVETAGEIAEEALQKSTEANAVYDRMVEVTRESEAIVTDWHNEIDKTNARIDEMVAMRGEGSVGVYELDSYYIQGVTIKSNGLAAEIAFTVPEVHDMPGGGNYYQTDYFIPAGFMPLSAVNLISNNDELKACIDPADVDENGNGRIVFEHTGVGDEPQNVSYSAGYILANPFVPELADARVGYDGTKYNTAGEAVRDAKETADGAVDLANGFQYDIADLYNEVDELKKNGESKGYTIYETEDHALALSDESGNIAATIKPNGEIDGNFPDKVAREKLKSFVHTDKYAVAFCDEQGYVAYGTLLNGEKVGFGGESGGASVTTFDYTKCGLPVLSFQEKEAGAHQEMIDAIKKDPDDKIEKVFTYVAKSPKGFVTPAIAAGDCTLKFQGSSSCRNQYPKYNYTFKAKTNTKNEDPEEPKFEATKIIGSRNGELLTMGNWGAQKKYCLKANWIDPSNARNVVNARLWASIVKSRASSEVANAADPCLLAAPNCGAINGFPVIIELNGEFRGLYTFNIPKEDWMFNGVNGEGDIKYIVGGESNKLAACGFKAEATFIDGGSQADTDFAIEYIPDKDDPVARQELIDSFNQAISAVMNANGTGWESEVEPYFDVQSAIDYYIFACCIAGEDNLQKNILYATYGSTAEDGDDKWFMSAYDLDTTMGSNPYGTSVFEVKAPKTQSFAEAAKRHRLFDLIYKYSKDKLKARYKELRSSVLSDENVWYMYNNFVNCIPRAVYNMDAERWADKYDKYYYPMPATTTANVENYMQYYRMHCALLDKEMEE